MHESPVVRKIWSALDGRLIFDVSVGQGARPDEPRAFARVTCGYTPREIHMIDIDPDRPTDFKLGFASGCKVEGVLQGPGQVQVDGVDSLGVFADMRFCAPASATVHFEGLLVTCPKPDIEGPQRKSA